METTDKNILQWEEKFNKYCEFELKCQENIKLITEVKNNLKNLVGHQEEDDLLFYKSLIDNSHFYITKSLRIRKIKFLKDLNFIWSRICERIGENKQMDEISKNNFMALLKDHRKMAEDIYKAKKNNTSLTWVKDDKVENLQDLENDFSELMDYHVKLIEFFSSNIELEKIFYYGK